MEPKWIGHLRIISDSNGTYSVSANDFVKVLQGQLCVSEDTSLRGRHNRNVVHVLIENVEGFIRDFHAAYPLSNLPEAQVPLEFRTLLDYLTQLLEHEKKDGQDITLLMSYKATLVRMHNALRNQTQRNEKS